MIYPEEVNGWDVEHSRSKIIETKDINFYNNYTDKEHLKRNEENSLFPECFIVNVTKESGCNTDLNIEIIVTLHKNEGKIPESIPFQHFVQISGMITNRLSLTDTVPQTRATNIAGTYILIRKCVLRLPIYIAVIYRTIIRYTSCSIGSILRIVSINQQNRLVKLAK